MGLLWPFFTVITNQVAYSVDARQLISVTTHFIICFSQRNNYSKNDLVNLPRNSRKYPIEHLEKWNGLLKLSSVRAPGAGDITNWSLLAQSLPWLSCFEPRLNETWQEKPKHKMYGTTSPPNLWPNFPAGKHNSNTLITWINLQLKCAQQRGEELVENCAKPHQWLHKTNQCKVLRCLPPFGRNINVKFCPVSYVHPLPTRRQTTDRRSDRNRPNMQIF